MPKKKRSSEMQTMLRIGEFEMSHLLGIVAKAKIRAPEVSTSRAWWKLRAKSPAKQRHPRISGQEIMGIPHGDLVKRADNLSTARAPVTSSLIGKVCGLVRSDGKNNHPNTIGIQQL
ncbi:hypothetical protein HAX54_021509 [Datura stramonium]|uniref:Uncharacterized protein n=1 Tax=Datura stramonium TaxID=4076 RepID=A0ABS8UV83_DATST|nr:hypothetical protein [Datura stramonium]